MPLSSIDHLCLMRYVFLGVLRKARRKDKEASAPGEDPKLYLEEAVLERKHGDLDLRTLVELPAGLDYNEWLASHSEYLVQTKSINSAYLLFYPTSPLLSFQSISTRPRRSPLIPLVGESVHTLAVSEWVGGQSILLSPL